MVASDTCCAQDVVLQRELASAANLVTDCAEGAGVTSDDAAKLSAFHRQVLKNTENYFKVRVDSEWPEPYGDTTANTTLFGQTAKLAVIAKLQNGHVDPAGLNVLRSFQLMLSASDMKDFIDWQRQAVMNER